MGLAFYKKLLLNYKNASLPLKISVPFIVMFLGFWTVSTTAIGFAFANQLEREQQKQAVHFMAMIQQEIDEELTLLQKEARLLSLDQQIIQGTIRENQSQVEQSVLNFSSTLNISVIAIVNRDKQQIFNLQDVPLLSGSFQTQVVQERLMAGSEFSAIVGSIPSGPPVLIGTAPIKYEQDIIGGVILGIALDNELLAQINRSIKEHIVILSDNNIVASTLPPDFDTERLEKLTLKSLRSFINIENQDFVTQSTKLDRLGDRPFKLVLLVSQRSLTQSLNALWLSIIPITCLGAGIIIVLAHWIAKKIANPILDISLIAQRVAKEQRFDLRATANTNDDISILALSLNQLIEWVEQYTCELEIAAQTLESKVEARTQELSATLYQLKETQAQLIQTEKMSSLGQMVAGIAHEMNNPISFIQGNIEPLEDYFRDLLALIETYEATYPRPEVAILNKQREIDFDFLLKDLNKILNSMNVGTERVHEIVRSLRNFSRLDEAIVKDVDIHEGLDSTLLILNHRIKYSVSVIKDYGDLPLARCLPAQINQVFTNIIANALDAMLEADCTIKRLTISTRAIANNQIQIMIGDSGPGIPEDIQAKIFDPFFTTKPVGKGTGLGLGICFKIIQQHHGTITVHSPMGQGTTFIITLPVDVLPPDPVMESDPARIA